MKIIKAIGVAILTWIVSCWPTFGKQMNRAYLFTLLLFSGCAGPQWIADPIVYSDRGGMSPQSEKNLTIALIEFDLKNELAGRTPDGGIKTWKQYWENRYTTYRKEAGGEQYVKYVRQRRKELSLTPI